MNMMNVVCATDDAYVPWCGVMLTSLRENHASTSIAVYILTEGLSDENKRALFSLENEKFHIHICQVEAESLKNLPIREGDHVSLATYYRLYLADILPSEINRIVYLDCDMVVTGDLTELMNVDCGECGIAAIRDDASYLDLPYARLQYDCSFGYFNAGVLVLDIATWRKLNIQVKLIEYINENPDRCQFHDQDALNGVFAGKWVELPLKFNLQTGFIVRSVYESLPDKSRVKEAIADLRVIHFTGLKPWGPGSKHPFVSRFMMYKDKSPWNHVVIPPVPRRTIKKYFYDLMCDLGIKKRFSTYIDICEK